MSRNIRQKYPRTLVKTLKRRGSDSSSLNLTDDDDEGGYSGLEDISESDEDDDDHVNAVEEEHLITQVVRKVPPVPARPQDFGEDADDAADAEDEDAAEEEEDEDEDDDDDDDEEDDDEGSYHEGTASWEGIATDEDFDTAHQDNHFILQEEVVTPVPERHVRFTGVPDSDSDSTTSDPDDVGDFFPDIFVEQSSLDPAFRREIERDDEDSSNSGSFWDFHSSQDPWAESDDDANVGLHAAVNKFEDNTPTATPLASEVTTAVCSPISGIVQELDGYESELFTG
jgi:hypothetical protein